MSTVAPQRRADITVRERLTFAAGDIFAGGASSLINVLYFIFLTDVIKLDPALAGTAVLVAKLWDAVNDPLTGALSDRTRTRLGRRRPFLLVGGVLLIPMMALFWNPFPVFDSQVGKMLWAMVTYLLYNTVQTVVAVPYASMSTEITTDDRQRNLVNTTRLLMSTVASASVTLLASWLFSQYRHGQVSLLTFYLVVVLGFGTLFTVVVLGVALTCRERVPVVASAPITPQTFVAPFRNRPFRVLLGMYISQALAMDVITATILYYCYYVVGGANSQVFLGTFIAVNVLAFPVVSNLVGRISKARVYAALLPVAIPAAVAVALYPSSRNIFPVYALALLLAVGMAGAQLMSWVMLPDVLDDAELETGERNAGSFTGVMTCSRGIATAVVLQVIGWVLSATGYVAPEGSEFPVQPGSAVMGIRMVMLVGIVSMLVAAWFTSRRYPITRQRALATQARLAERRGAALLP